MKFKYSEEDHANNLKQLLKHSTTYIHNNCPFMSGSDGPTLNKFYNSDSNTVCIMCRHFIGMSTSGDLTCPCIELDYSAAIKRTKRALKTKGYA